MADLGVEAQASVQCQLSTVLHASVIRFGLCSNGS